MLQLRSVKSPANGINDDTIECGDGARCFSAGTRNPDRQSKYARKGHFNIAGGRRLDEAALFFFDLRRVMTSKVKVVINE